MDEHHVCLPDALAADGLSSDERTAMLIDELEAWLFWRGVDERNLVMLVDDDEQA